MKLGPRARVFAPLLWLACAAGCGERARTFDAPLLRIAPDEAPASLENETRYAAPAHRNVLLFDEKRLRVPADGWIRLARALPAPLAGARSLLLAARVRAEETEPWVELPPVRVAVADAQGERRIGLGLRAGQFAGSTVELLANGFEPAEGGSTRLRSPEIELPAGAWFEAGLAVLPPARAQGAVEFRLRACEGESCEVLLEETLDPTRDRGWTDRRVPLGLLAGKRRAFELETRLAAGAPGAVSLPVWSSPAIYAPAAAGPGPRGIVLISIDTLRADHLSSYGYAFDTAPRVQARLAAEGLLFENAVAAATTTGPAHMTMFTSLQPSVHGLTDRPSPRRPAPITLAEVLRAQGLRTVAFTEDGPLHAGWGFARGFESYSENVSPNLLLPEGQIRDTFARGEAWLRAHASERFFLFLHTFQVHFPYGPPPGYSALFAGEAPPPPGLPPAFAPVLYDREIRYVDDTLGHLIETLESIGLLDETVIVFTSDHGEEFLEHGFLGHGAHLHPEVLHVPLIFRGPGIARGRRIAAPVGHVDLMPTLLELAGAHAPEGLMGRSLWQELRAGGDAPTPAPRPLYSEAWYPIAVGPFGKTSQVAQPSFSVRLGARTLVQQGRGGGDLFFDLARDPDERDGLRAADGADARALRALLESYPARMAELRLVADAARARFDAGKAGEPLPEVDPAVREKLRALGYVD